MYGSAVALILLGGSGTISVTANVAPRLMHEMVTAALENDLVTARDIHLRLLGLHRNLFLEANPIPVKWAVAQMGLIEPGIRLPLTPLSPDYYDRVRKAMADAGVAL
jgi:4-hydroxy-tetrahydrodipicolinate synthase